MKLSEYSIERQTRHSLKDLEISDFIKKTGGTECGSYYLLTLTQDRSSPTQSFHKIQSHFDEFMKKLRLRINSRTGRHQDNISSINVVEIGDRQSVEIHIHALIFVPCALNDRLGELCKGGINSKAALFWKGRHPKGSFDIRIISDEAGIKRTFQYMTKNWTRRIEYNDCGQPPFMRKSIARMTPPPQINKHSPQNYVTIASSGDIPPGDTADFFAEWETTTH